MMAYAMAYNGVNLSMFSAYSYRNTVLNNQKAHVFKALFYKIVRKQKMFSNGKLVLEIWWFKTELQEACIHVYYVITSSSLK